MVLLAVMALVKFPVSAVRREVPPLIGAQVPQLLFQAAAIRERAATTYRVLRLNENRALAAGVMVVSLQAA